LKKLRKKKWSFKPLDRGYYRDPVKMIKERIARFFKNLAHGKFNYGIFNNFIHKSNNISKLKQKWTRKIS